jgi:hypothetical protein
MEANVTTCLVHRLKPFRLALLLLLTWLSSAWTCSAFFGFNSCLDAVPQPQTTALLPTSISVDELPVLLTVDGTGFVSQSEIQWNGSPLQTTFLDSRHLQTMITQQTLDSFGGSAGSDVQISVVSPESHFIVGCPSGGSSGTLVLVVN